MRTSVGITLFSLALATNLDIKPLHAQPPLDLLKGTPVGSWQTRLQTSTNDKGETVAMTITNSLIGEEQRGGEAYVWIESEIQTTKTDKKGKSKASPPVVAKALVKRSAMEGNSPNVMRNPMGSASEIIMQVGDKDPMRYAGSSLNKAGGIVGLQVDYTWQELGSETVTVPGGTFDSKRLHGKGTAEMKVLIKKLTVESDADWWFSPAVPFGMVKAEGKNIVNGKPEAFVMQLQKFGTSGATSKITKPATDLPDLGEMLKGN